MDNIDQQILIELSQGIPLTIQPFNSIASKIGITPIEALTRLSKLKEEGVIRRFGANIKPTDVGFNANAVVAWKVPQKRIGEIGLYFASFKDVTHCYERIPVAGRWEYNLYTVLHAREKAAIEQMTRLLSEAVGIQDYVILYSKRDLKNCISKEKQQ